MGDKGITGEKRPAGTELGKASLTNAGFLSLQLDSLVQTTYLIHMYTLQYTQLNEVRLFTEYIEITEKNCVES